jgi:hypothetical protein
VPNGATIVSARLAIYKSGAYDVQYAVHRLLVDWTEAGASWNNRLPGVPWNRAGANGAGTDHAATADATASVGWDPGWIDLDVTAGVQQMGSGASNFGWRLRAVSGYLNGLKRMHSSEFMDAVELRPKLVITYR